MDTENYVYIVNTTHKQQQHIAKFMQHTNKRRIFTYFSQSLSSIVKHIISPKKKNYCCHF